MEWQEEGVILELRPYGERAFLLQILTPSHGRHLGLWRGSQKSAASFQPGTKVSALWKARLESQLGLWMLEPIHCPDFFNILHLPLPLLGLITLSALCRKTLPERQAYPLVYEAYLKALQQLTGPYWAIAVVLFELTLLKELGYGLCLEACVVTGAQKNLTHVSPVSGKAVCAAVAEPYKNRLLPLPAFLLKKSPILFKEVSLLQLQQAFRLTEVFLNKHVFDKIPGGIPGIRSHFLSRLYKIF